MRTEVKWRPGQEASLAPPCLNLRSFGSKCAVLKKVPVTFLGLFGAPRSDSAPGQLCPLVTPPLHSKRLALVLKVLPRARLSLLRPPFCLRIRFVLSHRGVILLLWFWCCSVIGGREVFSFSENISLRSAYFPVLFAAACVLIYLFYSWLCLLSLPLL